jgi:hypothetical protein
MRVIIPGHLYALKNLKDEGETAFQFYMDPEIHEGDHLIGPSCQEVLIMLIDRVITLDVEKKWEGNESIVKHLRKALAFFEHRAILYKTEEGFPIEVFLTGDDGHLLLKE